MTYQTPKLSSFPLLQGRYT